MRVKPKRHPNTNSGLMVCLFITVLLVYGAITWHVFGWSSYKASSGKDSTGSDLGFIENIGDQSMGSSTKEAPDSLDHFLESILIEGFPTHLTKKKKTKQAALTAPEQLGSDKVSESNKVSGSFRRPRLRGT